MRIKIINDVVYSNTIYLNNHKDQNPEPEPYCA